MRSFDSRDERRGGALLVALALLALAAALLAGSAQAGRAMARSAQAYGASITARSESHAALAEFLAGWSAASDSLRIGGSIESVIGPKHVGAAGMVAATRVRLIRVSSRRYVVGLESLVGLPNLIAARRRLTLIVERAPAADTSAPRQPPTPIARWSVSDLF